ncbi:MAG: hypothetical protein QOJ63_3684 [Solirubrobacteraceae bacterium]|jgi:hypothetical protein|nr:hypothetical protein [Solirubrobacteraceae bacterium]
MRPRAGSIVWQVTRHGARRSILLSLRAVRRTIRNAIACLGAVLAAGAAATPCAGGPATARADPARVLIVGDSLAVGTQPSSAR